MFSTRGHKGQSVKKLVGSVVVNDTFRENNTPMKAKGLQGNSIIEYRIATHMEDQSSAVNAPLRGPESKLVCPPHFLFATFRASVLSLSAESMSRCNSSGSNTDMLAEIFPRVHKTIFWRKLTDKGGPLSMKMNTMERGSPRSAEGSQKMMKVTIVRGDVTLRDLEAHGVTVSSGDSVF